MKFHMVFFLLNSFEIANDGDNLDQMADNFFSEDETHWTWINPYNPYWLFLRIIVA